MKVAFVYSDKERELRLAESFLAGVALDGDETAKIAKADFKDMPELGHDVYCMVGVKSLHMFRRIREAGKHVVYFDKGYLRHRGPNRTWEYWRVCVDDHHPTAYLEAASHSHERWTLLSKRRAIDPKAWRDKGNHVIFAGSSEKYHAFCGLPGPTEYAQVIVDQIKSQSNRLVVYRPKPTWLEAVPVKGASFSPREENMLDVLRSAHCLVTNGSNACFDAVLEGVPCIVLGNAIARPISSTSLADLENPKIVSYQERLNWLSNIAWCMFTEEEMSKGLAWAAVKPQFSGEFLDDTLLKHVHYSGARPTKAYLKKMGKWTKEQKKLTKAEQRLLKPFKKMKVQEPPDEWE